MQYILSENDEVCFAESYDDLLEQMKSRNSHTSGMSLEEYRKFAINNAAGFGRSLSQGANSEEISKIWAELGVITIIE